MFVFYCYSCLFYVHKSETKFIVSCWRNTVNFQQELLFQNSIYPHPCGALRWIMIISACSRSLLFALFIFVETLLSVSIFFYNSISLSICYQMLSDVPQGMGIHQYLNFYTFGKFAWKAMSSLIEITKWKLNIPHVT